MSKRVWEYGAYTLAIVAMAALFMAADAKADTVIGTKNDFTANGGAGGDGGNAVAVQRQQSTNVNRNSNRATSGSLSAAGAYSGGNDQSVTVQGDDVRSVSISAPALAAGSNGCAMSASGGGGGGIFSGVLGFTWEGKNCGDRANMATLVGIGEREAAVRYACQNSPEMARALRQECEALGEISTGGAPEEADPEPRRSTSTFDVAAADIRPDRARHFRD